MKNEKKEGLAFGTQNYKILIAALLAIISGYVLMSGGGSESPAIFNPEIFNFRRITLAPIFLLSGFAAVMFAIMKTK